MLLYVSSSSILLASQAILLASKLYYATCEPRKMKNIHCQLLICIVSLQHTVRLVKNITCKVANIDQCCCYCYGPINIQGVRKKDTHHFSSFFIARAPIFSKLVMFIDWNMTKKTNAKEKHLWCVLTWIGRFAWKHTFPANRLIRPANCLSENSAEITERPTWHQIVAPSTDGSTISEVTGCFAGNRAAADLVLSAQWRPPAGGAVRPG